MLMGTMTQGPVRFGVMNGMMAVVVEIGLMMMMAVVEEALLLVARGVAEVAVLLHSPVTMLLAVLMARHLLKVVQAVGPPLLSHMGDTAVVARLLMAVLLVAVLLAALLLVVVVLVTMMMGDVAALQASKALLALMLNKLKMLLDSVLMAQEIQLLWLLPALRRQLPPSWL